MRGMGLALAVALLAPQGAAVAAEQKRGANDEILTGVISGLLGGPQQSSEAAYTAQERDRLISLLQSGDYVTSRQGEPIDMMVFGIPLTHRDHVYSAKPIPPSQTYRQTP